jgi:putative colanic acid biosynthesis acetyltransferase WcaF
MSVNLKQDLSSFNNSWYDPGAGILKRFLWYCTNECWFRSGFPVNGWKIFLLRLFGAKVGRGVIVKPHVNIKYPWKLSIGDHVWIGEEAWIDNLAEVVIEDHVCISQGAMLLCGNHDYKKTTFDLMPGKITLQAASWVGAQSVVCPNVTVGKNAVLAVGSVASSDLDEGWIYRGNPAVKIKERN